MTQQPGTLCLGIDVAWWGGSPNIRASRVETIVAALVGEAGSLLFEDVDLTSARNLKATEYLQANYDGEGKLLAAGVAEVLERFAGRFDRAVLALDAPLLARRRRGQPERPKCHYPGRRSGLELRDAERALHAARKRIGEAGRAWNGDLKVQAGSPLPPRVEKLVARLLDMGFVLYRGAETKDERQLIEVFPSEAIWWLGAGGYYGQASSQEMRRYKARTWKSLAPDGAMVTARRPLSGLAALFHREAPASATHAVLAPWLERIAAHAVFCALHPRKETVVKNKRFDDVIDSGLAFGTALAFAEGLFHHWGDGDDGSIVGPGRPSL